MENQNSNPMQNRKTIYQFVLDRSGSMGDCWPATIQGLRSQFSNIRNLKIENPDQEFYSALCVFDSVIEFPKPLSPAGPNDEQYFAGILPRGGTALFDAIGDSIRHIEMHSGEMLDNNEASVVMVILTDGHENSSSRYSSDMIRREMDRLRATDLWSFAFIGADFDITATANNFNMSANSRMNVSKDNMHETFNLIDEKMHEYVALKKVGSIKKDFFQ